MVDPGRADRAGVRREDSARDHRHEDLRPSIVVLLRVDGCAHEHARYRAIGGAEYWRATESDLTGDLCHVRFDGHDSDLDDIADSLVSLQTRCRFENVGRIDRGARSALGVGRRGGSREAERGRDRQFNRKGFEQISEGQLGYSQPRTVDYIEFSTQLSASLLSGSRGSIDQQRQRSTEKILSHDSLLVLLLSHLSMPL